MKKTNSNKRFIIIASMSAVVFLTAGILLAIRGFNYKINGIKTYAVITNIEPRYDNTDGKTNYDVYVEFEADGRTITGRLDVYSNGMHVGKTIPVRYMPDNPENFTYGKAIFLLPVMLFIAATILLAFTVIPIKESIKNAKLEKFKLNGKKTNADIDDVSINNNVKILGKTPVKLTCSDENGVLYSVKFLSDSPRDYIVGAHITVYVYDGQYIVDTFDVKRCGTLTEN